MSADALFSESDFNLKGCIEKRTMARLKCKTPKNNSLLAVAAIVVYTTTAFAQSTKDACGATPVIPLTGEEPGEDRRLPSAGGTARLAGSGDHPILCSEPAPCAGVRSK